MNKIRWGILSTATISREAVIPAMQKCTHSEINAIASRKIEQARQVAEKFGISKAYGSYEELLADPEIDVIYNPLPNHLHVPWSIKALEAGKHVLCEKPISLTSKEDQHLVDFAKTKPHLKLMEAFMYRFHPQWQHAKQLVNNGEIGELRTIQSFFFFLIQIQTTLSILISSVAEACWILAVTIFPYHVSFLMLSQNVYVGL
jgi:predicted dehydrogenase